MDSMVRPALPLRFPLKTRLRLMAVVNPLLLLGLGGCLGLMALWLFLSPQMAEIHGWRAVLFWVMRAVLLLAVAACIVSAIMLAAQALMTYLSYLLVSAEGLEYRFWPSYHIRCTWDDVQAIIKRREAMVTGDVILLRQATEMGRPITVKMRKRLGMDAQYFIPLNIIEGWPTGRLKDALRHYAPKLFAELQ